eukprot:1156506-Pelagomonas_calceolata.AAC.5
MQVVGLLLCKGAMTMYRNTYGNTPLQVAKDKQSAEWIKRVQSVARFPCVQSNAWRTLQLEGREGTYMLNGKSVAFPEKSSTFHYLARDSDSFGWPKKESGLMKIDPLVPVRVPLGLKLLSLREGAGGSSKDPKNQRLHVLGFSAQQLLDHWIAYPLSHQTKRHFHELQQKPPSKVYLSIIVADPELHIYIHNDPVQVGYLEIPGKDGGEPERMRLVEEIKAANEAARKAEEEKMAAEAERMVLLLTPSMGGLLLNSRWQGQAFPMPESSVRLVHSAPSYVENSLEAASLHLTMLHRKKQEESHLLAAKAKREEEDAEEDRLEVRYNGVLQANVGQAD